MAPIKLGNLAVEIAVNSIDGFVHDIVDLPAAHGFWVTFNVRNDLGEVGSFPLVDDHLKIKMYDTYQEALYDAAQRLKGKTPRPRE